MKNLIIATAISLGAVSSVWAGQTDMQMTSMQQHQQAIIVHNAVNNANSFAHQKIVNSHKKMMGIKKTSTSSKGNAKKFSEMSKHEQAAIIHSFVKNGQSGPHQRESERQLNMIGAD